MPKVASQIRLDEELFNKIKYIAHHELRTMNAQMEYYLRAGVEKFEDKQDMYIDADMIKSAIKQDEE